MKIFNNPLCKIFSKLKKINIVTKGLFKKSLNMLILDKFSEFANNLDAFVQFL